MNVLITGHSSGIGAGLAEEFLERGDNVFGLSKSLLLTNHQNIQQCTIDLTEESSVSASLSGLLQTTKKGLDVVFLNAGVLGPIDSLQNTTFDELQYVMKINVWINKIILDWFLKHQISPNQIIAMSSGAAISGNYGWSSYALSKSTLNMLIKLYAHEFKNSQLLALAPGYVDTNMQRILRGKDSAKFPSLDSLHQAHGTDLMPSPEIIASKIVANLQNLKKLKSGSYYDLRNLEF